MNYRPDIDGLRAISVLLVVFYHADLLECHSGFIGVDVFFVISGYLVSQLIMRDLERGQFSLSTFFARRIRRLLPCLLTVCLATAGLGWFFMLPEEFKHLGMVLLSQPFLAANFVYAFTTKFGYFGATTVNYPLLHLWSLGVEEQFYVLFPLLLMRWRKREVFWGLFLASYGLSVCCSGAQAYYLLPTRAFEMLAGVLAGQMRGAAPGWTSPLALLVILLSGWWIPAGLVYPGWIALAPTLAAALLLWARGGPVQRLLAARPLVSIGLVSYSMYLWHWPLIALLRSSLLWKPHYGTYWLVLLLPISYASWRYIEQPLRRRPLSNGAAFRLAGVSGLVLAGLGLTLWGKQGFPERLPEAARKLAAQEFTPTRFNLEVTPEMVADGQVQHFGADGKTRLIVIGDSHAMAVLPGLEVAFSARGMSGQAITHSSTPPLLCEMDGPAGLRGQQLRDFCEAFERTVERENPPKVLLVAAWESYLDKPGFAAGLAATIKACSSGGRECYVMGQVPNTGCKAPRALAYAAWRGSRKDWVIRVPLAGISESNRRLQDLLRGLRVTYVDPLPFFYGPEGVVAVERDGLSLYRDEGHLSVDGSRLFSSLLLNDLGLK